MLYSSLFLISCLISNTTPLQVTSNGSILNNGGKLRISGSGSGSSILNNNGRLSTSGSNDVKNSGRLSASGSGAINNNGRLSASGNGIVNNGGRLRTSSTSINQRVAPVKSSIMNRSDVNLIKDKAYTADANAEWNKFDLYLPRSDSKPPLIIFIRGGLWVKGAKEENANMATKIASLGKAGVMVINYHLSPNAKNPTFIEDVAKAVIYAASNPDKLPYDPERLILMCHGTGCLMSETLLLNPTKVAPMAAFLGNIGFTERIKGAIGVEGVYDLPKHALTVSMTDLEIIKVAMGRARKDWIEGSPALNPPDSAWMGKTLPKHFLIQSRTDEFVDPIQTINYFNHLVTNSGYASIKPNLPGSHYLVLETDEFAKYISDVVSKVTSFATHIKNPQSQPQPLQSQQQLVHNNHHSRP